MNESLKGRMAESTDLNRVEADWFEEGGRGDNLPKIITSVLRMTEWKSGHDVNYRQAAKHTGKQPDE